MTKSHSILKYHTDITHKDKVRKLSGTKYRASSKHRQELINRVQLSRTEKQELSKELSFVMQPFKDKVKDGPEFVCCVCLRLFFIHQVLSCDRHVYVRGLANNCTSEQYLHKRTDDCTAPCQLLSCGGQLWICYTCYQKLREGETPAECWNKQLDPIPPELGCLNSI